MVLAGWRHAFANVALTGGNLVFLLVAFKLPTPAGFAISAGLIGFTSLGAWYLNLRRYRSVADTPTSRIISAPQGYVELSGRGQHPPGEQLKSPLSALPCLWYRYRIEKRTGNNKWRHVESGESDDTFALDDGSGMTLVDPEHAEILTSRKESWIKDSYRYTEWSLVEGSTLYVLGEHVTLGGAAEVLDARREVSELLAEWKRDRATLLARFDRDRNGEIDLQEWEQARKAAQAEVEQAHREIRLRDGVHLMRKAAGRMYLIADRSPEQLAARYRNWAWAHLALVFGACVGYAWSGFTFPV